MLLNKYTIVYFRISRVFTKLSFIRLGILVSSDIPIQSRETFPGSNYIWRFGRVITANMPCTKSILVRRKHDHICTIGLFKLDWLPNDNLLDITCWIPVYVLLICGSINFSCRTIVIAKKFPSKHMLILPGTVERIQLLLHINM